MEALKVGQRVMVEAVVDKPDGRETVKLTMAYRSNGRITEQVVSGIPAERIHPLPTGEGWQPIATAPKDGTRFLAGWWHTVRKGGDAQWVQIMMRYKECSHSENVFLVSCPGDWQYEATHWQPLPPPPQQTESTP